MHATIFDIERGSFVDGPGIRTTVFFKGCNLHCTWCHNPESQSADPQILFYKNKCTDCGRCKSFDPYTADFICFNDAKALCGKKYSVDELFYELLKDKSFYKDSRGGVTFSGGECMLQIDVLEAILKICKENGIHTAVDTAGHVPYKSFERILPYTDLFLYDIKCFDSVKHKHYTGVENELILENLKKLSKTEIPIWVRIPIIPQVNDSKEEIHSIKAFLGSCETSPKVELLPYNPIGEHKYNAIGKIQPKFPIPSEETMEKLNKLFSCVK